jgi:hypothetical protein
VQGIKVSIKTFFKKNLSYRLMEKKNRKYND